jgi:hypothetical protein
LKIKSKGSHSAKKGKSVSFCCHEKKKYAEADAERLEKHLGSLSLVRYLFVLNFLTHIDTEMFLIIFVRVSDFNSDLAGVWRRFTMHLSLASGGHTFSANLFSCDVN